MEFKKHIKPYILLVGILASSCTTTPEIEDNGVEESDNEYAAIDTDTTIQFHELSMYNKPYQLSINHYCLNDSAVYNPIYITVSGSEIMDTAISFTHNFGADLILKADDELIFNQHIDKSVFEDSLDDFCIEKMSLYKIEYDGVRTDKLYFRTRLGIPETGIIYEMMFAICYLGEDKGRLYKSSFAELELGP